MTYKITDPAMARRIERLQADGLGAYTLDDIQRLIEEGKMQSFCFGDTWVITQVHDFPQIRSVDMTFVIGHSHELLEKGVPHLEGWAHEIGAQYLTGSGRPGWWGRGQHMPGWRNLGNLYAKDLRNG